jgi:hypothetical protein
MCPPQLSSLSAAESSGADRFNIEFQALHVADAYARSFRKVFFRGGAPEFAVDTNHALAMCG